MKHIGSYLTIAWAVPIVERRLRPLFHICEPPIQVVLLGLSWLNPLILSVFCHGCRRWIRNIQASIGRYTRQVLKGAEICHLSCVGITVVGLTLCDTLSGNRVPNLLF